MILFDLPINIGVEQVLRAQGMKPDLVKKRSQKLFDIGKKAIDIGLENIEPRVTFEKYSIQKITPNCIQLNNGKSLEGESISKQLPDAQHLVAAICTIGGKIDELTSETFSTDPALALALEGFASSAVEILGNTFCNHMDELVASENLYTSLPINPGMVGWPIDVGQPQLFSLVDSVGIGVNLDSTGLMRPLKSLSLVIGIGSNPKRHHKSCDLCNLQKTCQYKPEEHQEQLLN